MNRRFILFLVFVGVTFANPMSPSRYHTGQAGSPCYGYGDCMNGLTCDMQDYVRGRPGSSGFCQQHMCSSSQSCGSGRMCNFDYGTSGTCESCRYFKSLGDCRAARFSTKKG